MLLECQPSNQDYGVALIVYIINPDYLIWSSYLYTYTPTDFLEHVISNDCLEIP